jgi:transcriptional regulator with XRE-family HTH domain
MQQIGKKLREIRKRQRISATEIAGKIGVSRTTVWRFENGGDMSVVAMEKYAEYLKLEIMFYLK